MMQLRLYHYWRSSCSWRVRWTLELKEIAFESVPVNLLKAEHMQADYLEKNPAGRVPVLEADGNFMTESMAIMEWLEETFHGYKVLPSDPKLRYQVRRLCLAIVADTQPMQNLAAQRFYSDDPEKRKSYAQHWITKGLRVFEAILGHGEDPFCVGDQVTMADICLIPQVYNARRFAVDLSQFPKICRIEEACLATRACQAAAPDNQTGAIIANQL